MFSPLSMQTPAVRFNTLESPFEFSFNIDKSNLQMCFFFCSNTEYRPASAGGGLSNLLFDQVLSKSRFWTESCLPLIADNFVYKCLHSFLDK